MRPKDESKREAILQSAMVLINTYGLAHTSISKIAKEAGVSPATIYIYFANKEDLLTTLYVEVRREMAGAILDSIDESLEVVDAFRLLWENLLAYYLAYPDHFVFAEQFNNSPIVDSVDPADVDTHFEPYVRLIERGQALGQLKEIPANLINAFVFYPLTELAKHHVKAGTPMEDDELEAAFDCAWDAIRA